MRRNNKNILLLSIAAITLTLFIRSGNGFSSSQMYQMNMNRFLLRQSQLPPSLRQPNIQKNPGLYFTKRKADPDGLDLSVNLPFDMLRRSFQIASSTRGQKKVGGFDLRNVGK